MAHVSMLYTVSTVVPSATATPAFARWRASAAIQLATLLFQTALLACFFTFCLVYWPPGWHKNLAATVISAV